MYMRQQYEQQKYRSSSYCKTATWSQIDHLVLLNLTKTDDASPNLWYLVLSHREVSLFGSVFPNRGFSPWLIYFENAIFGLKMHIRPHFRQKNNRHLVRLEKAGFFLLICVPLMLIRNH